ncbi:MAG: transposase [Paracoccaceae bacterium]
MLIQHLDLLRIAYSETLAENPFRTDSIVMLPDHLHAVWTLPGGDTDYSTRWRKIKGRFTRMVKHSGRLKDDALRKGERGIWERRFWERELVSVSEICKHVEYCWSDPVRHRIVKAPAEWEASSLHREIRAGKVDKDWQAVPLHGTFGERNESPDLLETLSV